MSIPVVSVPDWKLWKTYQDIRLERAEGIAKITICRPEVRNAFRPKTLFELCEAFHWVARGPRGRRRRSSPERAARPSARAETSACAATPATSGTTACRG